MDDNDADVWFQAFDCPSVPLDENTRAEPRAPHRPRRDGPIDSSGDGILVTFEAEFVTDPPGTLAAPRPPGRERNPVSAGEVTVTLRATDGASAAEVLRKVQDVLRSHGMAIEVVRTDSDR